MPDELNRSIDEAAEATRNSPVAPGATEVRLGESAAPRSSERDTGAALRSVYQKTVDEVVPDEMLDLLGKLS